MAEESRISLPHALRYPVSRGSKRRWKGIQIFTEYVFLPSNSCICNSVGKLIEVDARGYLFSSKELEKLQQDHPDLLVEWVDCETLCFQMPSSSGTNIASKFDGQINCYLKRHCRTSEIDTRPSSSLFKATAPSAQGKKICANLTIFELTGYGQKLAAAHAEGLTVPEGVRVYATIEMQNINQTEDVIRDACRKEAHYMECISIAVLVKTGYVEIYSATQRLYCMYNPLYIDVGCFCPQLQGLRLYMDPLRHTQGWPYPRHPNSYSYEDNSAGSLPTLVAAIKANNFDLAENILNYVDSFNGDECPLLEAVKKAVQQVPAAHAFVQYLLSNGAQPSQDMQQISAILVATAAKDQPMANLLQRNGAPPPNLSPDLLVAAVQKRDVEFATLLIRAGADPNQPNSHGQLALVVAIPSMTLVEAIANTAGHVDIRKKDCRGLSAFSLAKRMNERETLKFLQKKEGRGESSMWGIIKDIFFKREGR